MSNHTGNFAPARLASVDRLVLIAAGTGFTPMASVIQYFHFRSVRSPGKVKKEAVLLFFNKTRQDIIWKEQLDRIERETSGSQNFSVRVLHILSQDLEWPGPQGQIRAELLKELLGQAGPDGEKVSRLCCVCGPTPFTETAQRLVGPEVS